MWENFKAKDRKKKIFYIVIILLVLLVLILGGLFAKRYFNMASGPANNTSTPKDNTPTAPLANAPTTIQPREATPEEKAAEAKQEPARLIAQPFVERFGSYNNQGDFTNFADLEFFMTDSLKEWVNSTYIPKLKAELPSIDTYFAVNTRALSTDTVVLDEAGGKAELLINTQRQELGAGGEQTRIYYQTAKVAMVKVENEWKIDAVYWQ